MFKITWKSETEKAVPYSDIRNGEAFVAAFEYEKHPHASCLFISLGGGRLLLIRDEDEYANETDTLEETIGNDELVYRVHVTFTCEIAEEV